jgi:peptidoglycan lytic transglycosylase G
MRRLLAIFVLLLLALGAATAWAAWALHQPYQDFAAEGVFVDVPRGAARRTVARLLADQGVIRNRVLFEALTRWRSGRTLQAGEYFFDRPATTLEVFDKIAAGRIFVRELVVPEGYSIFQIANLVEREGLTTREDFLAAARNPELARSFAPRAPSMEGFLFPATYQFPRHMSGQEIVTAMARRFQQEWEAVSAQGLNPAGLSLQQAVTLASLIESETPQPEERPLVAGVFLNRLKHRIPLQCDPTVAYAMELAGRFGGKLEARDLRFDSPYNTYRHIGLPPGPIANPGTMSLRAALDPSPTDWIYFVANAEGGHVFSRTLAEHNRNVAHYRQLLEQQRRAARIAAATVPATSPERSP